MTLWGSLVQIQRRAPFFCTSFNVSRPEISTILRLLDDEDQEVREGIQQALLSYHGDASDDLAALGITLAPEDSSVVSLKPSSVMMELNNFTTSSALYTGTAGTWRTRSRHIY